VTDSDAAGQALVTLRRRVDAHFTAAVERNPDAFACRAGCASCCRAGLSVFGIEADRIRAALAQLPSPTRLRVAEQAAVETPTHCPLLVDGLCSIYTQRPILCRSHGLAVRAPGAQGQVDWCELNYTETTPPAASVLALDAVNQPLAVMAQMWGGERTALADLAR